MLAYRFFADILDYPTPVLSDRIAELLPLAKVAQGETAQLLYQFREFVEKASPEKQEELYTGTFDLQPLCCPYIGYQLFGEEYRRGMFMAQLREHYRFNGFDAGNDLPDHLCVILRFLACRQPGEVERDLVMECMIPALDKMIAGFVESTNPYREVLQALILLLRGYPGDGDQVLEGS